MAKNRVEGCRQIGNVTAYARVMNKDLTAAMLRRAWTNLNKALLVPVELFSFEPTASRTATPRYPVR